MCVLFVVSHALPLYRLCTASCTASCTADQDAEVDFLLNAAHIQLHRRARALARLARLLRRGGEAQQQAPAALGLGTLVGVVQPLLLQMIVEGKGGAAEEGGHEQKQADLDRGANVTDAAVVALGVVAAALPWVQYQQLLGQHLRLVKKHAGGRYGQGYQQLLPALLAAAAAGPSRRPAGLPQQAHRHHQARMHMPMVALIAALQTTTRARR